MVKQWATRVSLGVTLAATCLAVQWALMAYVGPDESVIRNGLAALNPNWRDVGAMTDALSDSLRERSTAAAAVSTFFALAAALIWIPQLRRDRSAVLSWQATAWVIAVALPAVFVVSFIATETSHALT